MPRPRPRYLSFLLTGAAAGLLVTVVVLALRRGDVDDPTKLGLYLGALLVGVGALLGGLVAVLLEGDPGGPGPAEEAPGQVAEAPEPERPGESGGSGRPAP